jgi:hypothetical protein
MSPKALSTIPRFRAQETNQGPQDEQANITQKSPFVNDPMTHFGLDGGGHF